MTKEEILEWLKVHNKNNEHCQYTINDDMSIDVDGSVNLIGVKDNRIPGGIKFNIVSGNFDCFSINLTSLKGCPEEVGGDFDCADNELTSLEGGPKKVGRTFYGYKNKLTSLKGAPEEVGAIFYCTENELTSLEGAPKKVGSTFYCYNNKLTSLKGAPEEVGKGFECTNNNLISLEGCPKKVGGKFNCSDNKLVNLKYMPVIKSECHTDFTKEEVKVEQDIMKQAKTYEEGVQAYQEYLDIFGDE